jgi:glutathione peroxidase
MRLWPYKEKTLCGQKKGVTIRLYPYPIRPIMNAEIYSFKTKTLNGGELDFLQFQGKLLLIVNTASQCGFTPQYEGLEKLYRDYREKGLVVIGFPCNQFGNQEPGDAVQIGAFCSQNYGVSFPMSEKVEVNGPGAHPVFAYLTQALPGALGTQAIKWNFTKFLIDQEGKPIRRYGSVDKPEKIGRDIQALLG